MMNVVSNKNIRRFYEEDVIDNDGLKHYRDNVKGVAMNLMGAVWMTCPEGDTCRDIGKCMFMHHKYRIHKSDAHWEGALEVTADASPGAPKKST